MIAATWEERVIGEVYHDQVVEMPACTATGLSFKVVREATQEEYLAECPWRARNLNGAEYFYKIEMIDEANDPRVGHFSERTELGSDVSGERSERGAVNAAQTTCG